MSEQNITTLEHSGEGLWIGAWIGNGVFDRLRKVKGQRGKHAARRAGEHCQSRGYPRQFPRDAFEVEANAAIAQHRDEMKQDATNAESSENRHTRFLNGRAGSVVSELDGSLLTNPTHLYPPGGGAARRSPLRGICPAVPFSGNSNRLWIRRF